MSADNVRNQNPYANSADRLMAMASTTPKPVEIPKKAAAPQAQSLASPKAPNLPHQGQKLDVTA